MNPIFLASVIKGKLVYNNPEGLENYLQSLNDKSVDVLIRLPKKDRSHEQNRYYWGVIIRLLSEHLGYSDDEMHDALKMLFLKDESRKIPTLRSTTELSTTEFEKYLEEIRMWAAQLLGFYIPLPNEVDF